MFLQPIVQAVSVNRVGSGGWLIVRGTFRDVVFARALSLVSDPTVRDLVRRCPECSRLFRRVKAQTFCPWGCRQRAANRRRLASVLPFAKRLARAERAHEQYKAKKRQEHPNVKVTRRPRLKRAPPQKET